MQDLLTLDFLRARLKQAESDVMTYTLMIDEVTKLIEARSKAKMELSFLRVVKGNDSKEST